MILLIYLIKTVFISGLFLAYYWLFLRNRVFHGFNRFFLLVIPVFSLIIPAFHFSIPDFWNQAGSGSPIRLLGVGGGSFEEAVTIYANPGSYSAFSWLMTAGILSGTVSILLFIRLYKTIRFLHQLGREKPSLLLPEAVVFFVSEKGTPFSFFRNIYWGEELDIHSAAGRQILRHEIFHVKNNHSLDILVIEIFSILCWFNPFFHMLRRELRAIHEYAADAYATAGSDEFEYASLLLRKDSGPSISLTHPFFKNQIKRRILMITKIQKNNKNLLGRLMILPLVLALICLFSFKIQNHFHVLNSKPIRVVIDAGHGGSFTGAEFNGLLEKNINLLIAKKIQSISAEYNVEVIMSRDADVTPGSNELRESLEYIAGLPKNKNADLFISIHTNSTETAQEGKLQTSKSGFQIYIPRKTSKVYDGSVKFGSVVTEMIKSDFIIESELKQPPGDGNKVLILREATVPALLIECGYLDNPADLKYLQDEKNQEKIARDILEGIKKYSQQNTGYYQGKTISAELPVVLASGTDAKQNEKFTGNTFDSAGPYKKVEIDAEFPGGSGAWANYLFKTLHYPDAAAHNEIQGEVIVEFVVQKDGSLDDIHAISGPEPLRAESVRVISMSGKWTPAVDKGKQVASYHKQPINYKLAVK